MILTDFLLPAVQDCWVLAEGMSENLSYLAGFQFNSFHVFFPTAQHSLPWRLFLSLLLIKMRKKWRLEDFHFIFFGVVCLLFVDGGKLEQVKRKQTSKQSLHIHSNLTFSCYLTNVDQKRFSNKNVLNCRTAFKTFYHSSSS